jgi:hypothetical protein
MTATMIDMDYRLVDRLGVDQVMENDLVEINDEIVQVIKIESVKNGFEITYQNEFGEKETTEFNDSKIFDLYV